MPSTRPDLIHVVWSPVTGPVAAYRNLHLAARHSETMVGVEVSSCDLLGSLPAIVIDQIVTEDYDVEDPTPVTDAPEDAETRVVDVDDTSPQKR